VNPDLIDKLVNSRLADTAPALVGVVAILSPLLWVLWRIYHRATVLMDKWFSRHEEAEKAQFATVSENTNATVRMSQSMDRLALAIDAQTRELHDRTVDWKPQNLEPHQNGTVEDHVRT